MSKSVLAIIESNKKADVVRRSLEDFTGKKVFVVATRGRLFDISLSSNKQDLSTVILDDIYEPVDPFIHDKIRKTAELCNTVYLLTDNDAEGEVIANDVYTRLLPDSVTTYRCPLKEVTETSIKHSLENPRTIDQAVVRSTVSQRLFDLKISSLPSIIPNSLSRILAPVLDTVLKGPLLGRRFSISHPNDERVTISGSTSIDNIDEIRERIKDIKFKGVRVRSDKEIFQMDTIDLINTISINQNKSAKKSIDLIQESYEQGKISYPRTSSRSVTDEVSLKIRKLAAKQGIQLTSDLKTQNSDNHLGVYPLIEPKNDLDITTLSESEMVSQLLWNKMIESDESSGLRQSIDEQFYTDDEIACSAKLIYSELNESTQPLPQKEFLTKKDYGLSILNLMSRKDIGTPASRNLISIKIAKNYINQEGRLNKKGFQLINDIKENYPSLLNDQNHERFEEMIENSKIQNPIKLANELFGIYVDMTTDTTKPEIEAKLTTEKTSLNI